LPGDSKNAHRQGWADVQECGRVKQGPMGHRNKYTPMKVNWVTRIRCKNKLSILRGVRKNISFTKQKKTGFKKEAISL
jgi:hypothetical protein